MAYHANDLVGPPTERNPCKQYTEMDRTRGVKVPSLESKQTMWTGDGGIRRALLKIDSGGILSDMALRSLWV